MSQQSGDQACIEVSGIRNEAELMIQSDARNSREEGWRDGKKTNDVKNTSSCGVPVGDELIV